MGRGWAFALGDVVIYLALVDEIFRNFRNPPLAISFDSSTSPPPSFLLFFACCFVAVFGFASSLKYLSLCLLTIIFGSGNFCRRWQVWFP
jgi:hypothetical protein